MKHIKYKTSFWYLGLIVLGLCCSSTASWARSRCQTKEAQLLSLSKRLERAESPKLWQSIYQESTTALELIENKHFNGDSKDDPKTVSSSNQIRTQLLCVQELLFESAFFLSDNRVKGALWSMRALGHAVSLSSLSQAIFTHPETKDRLRLLLKRVNRRTKVERKIKKAFKFGKHKTIFIPTQTKPYRLQLSIKQETEWLKRCGLFEGCKDAIQWKVYSQLGSELSFNLPAADYKLQWSGACVQHSNELSVNPRRNHTNEVEIPKMYCFSEIELLDELSQELIPFFDLPADKRPQITIDGVVLADQSKHLKAPENSKISVSYQGYKDQTTTVPMQGAKLKLLLKRCALSLVFQTQPKDLKISGPKRVYWGQPYTLKFERNGYMPLSKNIIVDKPESCSDAKYSVDVKLSRQIEVKAYDPQGLKIKLSSLKVGGLSLNSQDKTFRRPEGRYQVIARTKDYPKLTSQLLVSPCEADRCEQAQLKLYFQDPPPVPMTTRNHIKWFGTSMLSAGLGLFIYNFSANRYRDQELSYNAPLVPIQDRLSSLNRWSIALVSSGLFTVALGYAWPYLTSDPSDKTLNGTFPKKQKDQL